MNSVSSVMPLGLRTMLDMAGANAMKVSPTIHATMKNTISPTMSPTIIPIRILAMVCKVVSY